jgi:thiosulfate/3-mercaptopyruvate sulfurtransferase
MRDHGAFMSRLRRRAAAVLVGTAAIAGTVGTQPGPARSAPAISPLVTTEWLQAELARPDLVIIQLSSPGEFEKAHIPGAVAVDFNSEFVAPPVEGGLRVELPDPAALQRVLRAKGVTPTSRIVVVFEQPMAFTRAGRAFFTLEWAGLAGQVAVLDGGLPKWVREGRPTATGGARAVAQSGIVIHPDPARRATKEQVRAAVGSAATRIVDARDTVFYLDIRDNNMPRGGHIASAVSLPYSTVTNADGTLRSRAELEGLVAAAGLGGDAKLVSYCHIGMQASWMYFTLRYLGRDVAMFDGSFDEWSRDPAMPIEGAKPRP